MQELGSWSPMTPDEVAHLLRHAEVPWWIAGGWAVDLHLGRQTRQHDDIDVLVLRPHLSRLREELRGWELHAADPPGTLRRWPQGEPLPGRVHDVWCRPGPTAPWRLQLMVDDLVAGIDDGIDGAEESWVYRRDPRISRPWKTLTGPSSNPRRAVLAPEVQLLHKSVGTRPKDDHDFTQLIEVLDGSQRAWLAHALHLTEAGHPWIGRSGAVSPA